MEIYSTTDDPHDQQGRPYHCHYSEDAMTSNYSLDAVISLCTGVGTQTYLCKNLLPLEAIKGEAGHRLKAGRTHST